MTNCSAKKAKPNSCSCRSWCFCTPQMQSFYWPPGYNPPFQLEGWVGQVAQHPAWWVIRYSPSKSVIMASCLFLSFCKLLDFSSSSAKMLVTSEILSSNCFFSCSSTRTEQIMLKKSYEKLRKPVVVGLPILLPDKCIKKFISESITEKNHIINIYIKQDLFLVLLNLCQIMTSLNTWYY